jgi:hypothetical protein
VIVAAELLVSSSRRGDRGQLRIVVNAYRAARAAVLEVSKQEAARWKRRTTTR